MSFWFWLCTVFLVPGHLPIRGDDPGLIYVPVGPTSDFRIKVPVSDQQGESNNITQISTASPFGPSDETLEVWVLLGGRAALPCNIKPSVPNEHLVTVLWYRGTQGEPIYTYDARAANATSWSEEAPRGFGPRALFDPNSNPSLLFVDHIVHDEGGHYRCRVDFKTAQTRNSLINLTIIVPPSSPTILNDKGIKVGSTIGPFDEGSALRITCLSAKDGCYPLPRLVWHSNPEDPESQPIDTTYELTSTSDATQNALVVKTLSRDLYKKTFWCLASNNNVTQPSSTNVTVDLKLLPLNVSILEPVEPFSLSRPATIECRSVGSRPPAIITWWKRGKFMGKPSEEFSKEEHGETLTISRITFHPKINDHEKEITCRAENTEILNSAIDDHKILNVHYPPKVQLTLGKNIDPLSIAEGNDVYLDCAIKANPRAYKVEWLHNGIRVETAPEAGVRVLAEGKNLVLQGIKRVHAGNYTCTAFNLEGEDTSNILNIRVMFKPECFHPDPVTLGIAPQRDAEVLCHMRAMPVATHFRWTFNNSFEASEVQSGKYGYNGTHSTLNYRAESNQDFGIVKCWAANHLGETQKPCIFTLIPAGPPELPRDCDVHNHTTMGLAVTCSSGFGGGLPQQFHMEVRDRETGEQLQNQTSDEPVFTINFKTNRGVNLKIYSSNAHGRSLGHVQLETTPSKVAELQIETPPKKDIGADLMIGVVLGLLTTLTLFALLILAFVKVQTRRRGNGPPPLQQQPPPSQQAQQHDDHRQMTAKGSRTFLSTSPSSSEDPDVIPLQMSKLTVSASSNVNINGTRAPNNGHLNNGQAVHFTTAAAVGGARPQVPSIQKSKSYLSQTGLEERPPPPSIYPSSFGRDIHSSSNMPLLPALGSGLSASTSSPSGSQGSWSQFSDGLSRNLSPGFRNLDRFSSNNDRFRPGVLSRVTSHYEDVRNRGPVVTAVSVLQPEGWPPRLRSGSGSQRQDPTLTTF